jgi:hypothetical protein
MAISRAQLLKELLPGLNGLFGMEYKNYERRQREKIGGNGYIHGVLQGETPTVLRGTSEVDETDAQINPRTI